MKKLTQHELSEHQFTQLIRKIKSYNYLPKEEKAIISSFLLNDGQVSTITKDYYQDEKFCKNTDGSISLWKMYNLFTSANKSSYIDTFLIRNLNAFEFVNGLVKALNGNENHHWFLS